MTDVLRERIRQIAADCERFAASPYTGGLTPQEVYGAVAADLRDALGDRPTSPNLEAERIATTEPGSPPLNPEEEEPERLPPMKAPRVPNIEEP